MNRLLLVITFFLLVGYVNGQSDDSIIVEKPGLIEDDGNIDLLERDELLKVKSSDFLDVDHSRKMAPYYSLILPGAGHYKLDRKKSAKSFMLAEGLLWAGFAFSMYHRSQMTDNLRAFLFTYGRCDGVRSDVAGKSAWNLSENELQLPLYNDSSSQYTMRIYKPSRSSDMIKADYYWSWSSEEAHQEYYDMWKERNTAKVAALYFAGAAILNRVGSFIHARWLAKNSDTIERSEAIPIIWTPFFTENHLGMLIVIDL
jgi:hypothetical protein